MSNINFDNPLLLLVLLPLLAVVAVPFFIAVRKDNVNLHNVLSLVLHVVICVCVSLAISGMSYEKVITETNVYVLADVSYSAEHSLDEVQESVNKIAEKLPKNSKMSVICFGRNYQMISDLGDGVPNIASADKVDRSATDIASVLRYAGNIFDEGVIKRIIVVTDGAETISSNNIVKVVGSLSERGILVDAVYIDDNIPDDVREIQIDAVDAVSSTYLGKEEEARVLLRVNAGAAVNGSEAARVNAYVSLFGDGTLVARKAVSLYDGLNTVSIPLSTSSTGIIKYEVKVEPESEGADYSSYNNSYAFTQRITDERNVLFLGGSARDISAGRTIYGEKDVTYIDNPSAVPLGIEDMCEYDEIVLCNFDVRTIPACDMFLSSLAALVDDYGKTLTTYGNTFIQEDDPAQENTPLKKLEELLPVRIGNFNQDKRLIAIVLDVSLSMGFNGRFAVAQKAAVELIKSLNTTDTVMVVGFSGVIDELLPPTALTATKVIVERINEATVQNGTNLSAALTHTYELMPRRYHDRQVIIISDGLDPEKDRASAKSKALEMSKDNICVSALGIFPSANDGSFLNDLVKNSAQKTGSFYKSITHESQAQGVIQSISEETRQIRMEGDYEVTVQAPDEEVLRGVTSLGNIGGFWYSQAKDTEQTKTVVTAKYFRDRVTSFDVPLYVYWKGGGKGKVVSFLSDISSLWTSEWTEGSSGARFLENIPSAALPDERITAPFILDISGKGNATLLSVKASASLPKGAEFSATVKAPNGLQYHKLLAFDSDSYLATFTTDSPGTYSVHLEYSYNDLHYESEAEFTIPYYAEYDSFASYSKSYLYRLLGENGKILELDEISVLDLPNAKYTVYTFSFTIILMIICAVLFVIDVIVRQIKWQDIKSFLKGLGRRRK